MKKSPDMEVSEITDPGGPDLNRFIPWIPKTIFIGMERKHM
jgi:hypothetical protein